MFIFFIRNFRGFSLAASLAAFFISSVGLIAPAEALDPSSTDQIDGLVDGQTTYGPNGYWKPYIEADGFVWDKAASNGNLRLWSPLIQNPDWIVHTTIGGGFFETDGLQGSAGIGFRHVIGDAILGVYGFTDVTFTENGNTFWRVSPGIELLGLNYEARLNGYIPIGEDQHLVGNSVSVGGGGGMSGLLEYETNFLGIDGEIGFRLPVEIGEEKLHDFWLYGGANYYDHENTEELYGADARFEWRINKLTEEYPGSRLSFIANASWNNVDNFDYGGGIRARIPLGKRARCFNRYPDERTIDCPTRNGRMDAAVVRRTRGDSTIVENEILFDPETDVDMLTVVTVNDGDSSLVLGNPPIPGTPSNFNTLNDATAATSEVLIVVDGDATPAGGYGAGFVDSDTTVLGTGTTIPLEGRASGMTYQYMVAGARPQFDFGGTGPTLTLDGTGIHIAGLEINASPPSAGSPDFNHGIFIATDPAFPSSNIAIEQNEFSDIAADGIASAGPTTDIRIFDNVFSDIDQDGIDFENNNDFIQIYDNEFGNLGENAIEFSSDNDNVSITENDIGFLNGDPTVVAAIGHAGISFADRNNDAVISGNDIRNTLGSGSADTTTIQAGAAIEFLDNNLRAVIENNNIVDVAGRGIDFRDGNNDSTVFNNRLNGVGEEGIRFDSGNINTLIDRNDVFDTGVTGIYYSEDNERIRVTFNRVYGSLGPGIRLGNGNELVEIDDNTIIDVSFNGIVVASNNGSTAPVGTPDNFIRRNKVYNSINTIDPQTSNPPVRFGTGMTNGIAVVNNNIGWEIGSNEIYGVDEAGIRLSGGNANFDIVDNVIDGSDWSSGTPIANSKFTDHGIYIVGGNNSNIQIGGPAAIPPTNPGGFSNRIFNIVNNGVYLEGNSGSPNIAIEIDNNSMTDIGGSGVYMQVSSVGVEITNNRIENAQIGVRLGGGTTVINSLARRHENLTIQDNDIINSITQGMLIGNYNFNLRIIGNRINGVSGTTVANGDAIAVGTNNSIGEISGNTITGQINDDIFQFGASNTFPFPANNTNNDASGATFIAGGTSRDCSATVIAGPQVSLITVTTGPNLGATIDCP